MPDDMALKRPERVEKFQSFHRHLPVSKYAHGCNFWTTLAAPVFSRANQVVCRAKPGGQNSSESFGTRSAEPLLELRWS